MNHNLMTLYTSDGCSNPDRSVKIVDNDNRNNKTRLTVVVAFGDDNNDRIILLGKQKAISSKRWRGK